MNQKITLLPIEAIYPTSQSYNFSLFYKLKFSLFYNLKLNKLIKKYLKSPKEIFRWTRPLFPIVLIRLVTSSLVGEYLIQNNE